MKHATLPTDHSKDIRVVHGALQTTALVQVGPIEHPRDGQTIITSKGVDDHGASSISGLGTRKHQSSLEPMHVSHSYKVISRGFYWLF